MPESNGRSRVSGVFRRIRVDGVGHWGAIEGGIPQ